MSFIGTVALTGVTYQGNLDLTAPDSDLVATNLTLETAAGAPDGTFVVSGTNAGLDFGDGSTLNDVTIDLASFNGASIGANTANAVFGSHVTINETGPFDATIGGGGTLTSAATINVVGTPGQAGGLQIAGGAFFNNGTITIAPTAYLTLSSTYLQNDSSIQSSDPLAVDGTGIFVNDGTVVASNGLLLASAETVNRGTLSISGNATLTLKNYYDHPQPTGTSFENAGVVMLTGATVGEVLSHGVPGVAVVNDSGATLEGTGIFTATLVNDGKVDAVGGALTLGGNIAGVGQLDISADATLSVVSSVVNGQTATFGGADGVLGLAPKTFLGEISGFAAGDTIDLLQTAASGASFKGDSIVVTLTAGGSLTLRTVGALSGSLAVTSDGNDGTLIGFVGAAVHAADVPAGAWDQASPAATSVPEVWERFVPTADGLQPAWFAGLGHYGALFN